jgi:hypothetical protein
MSESADLAVLAANSGSAPLTTQTGRKKRTGWKRECLFALAARCYTTSMDIENLTTQLKQEVARINQAISALEVLNETRPRHGGPSKWPVKAKLRDSTQGNASSYDEPPSRAKIADARRARWAKHKARVTTTKASLVKTTRRGRMSSAARERLSIDESALGCEEAGQASKSCIGDQCYSKARHR